MIITFDFMDLMTLVIIGALLVPLIFVIILYKISEGYRKRENEMHDRLFKKLNGMEDIKEDKTHGKTN